ncbi:putative retrotransposon protein with reverse transcriptase [Klebsormidium nitens]|uniref:Putative retrotransposon protein with reverse transcriptase n=1 Tax=Klebsormidium nitens TaxID=105231 RepID=A0A1Y1INP0_KLENI|nr:putative retrotransposon protein with reverse transcriptase [Klebsormidium nitens]|eukprot:GAQ92364.1 putative retrotransposon protein with reverse transcriptase [Klebsormidium nitens]
MLELLESRTPAIKVGNKGFLEVAGVGTVEVRCEAPTDERVNLLWKELDSKESTELLELVHMDVCGPMPVTSKGGSRYLPTFLDDYSKFSMVQPMKRKSDVTAVTEGVFARLRLQVGKKSRQCKRTGMGITLRRE